MSFGRALQHCWRAIVFGVIGLAVGVQTASAETAFDGVYTGKRVLMKGTPGPCPTGETVSVTIHGDALTFTNSRLRNFPMGFYPHPDGSFSQISVGVESSSVLIEGRIVGDTIDADVADGSCKYHWHLKRGP